MRGTAFKGRAALLLRRLPLRVVRGVAGQLSAVSAESSPAGRGGCGRCTPEEACQARAVLAFCFKALHPPHRIPSRSTPARRGASRTPPPPFGHRAPSPLHPTVLNPPHSPLSARVTFTSPAGSCRRGGAGPGGPRQPAHAAGGGLRGGRVRGWRCRREVHRDGGGGVGAAVVSNQRVRQDETTEL